jgi:hypothetical protein
MDHHVKSLDQREELISPLHVRATLKDPLDLLRRAPQHTGRNGELILMTKGVKVLQKPLIALP